MKITYNHRLCHLKLFFHLWHAHLQNCWNNFTNSTLFPISMTLSANSRSHWRSCSDNKTSTCQTQTKFSSLNKCPHCPWFTDKGAEQLSLWYLDCDVWGDCACLDGDTVEVMLALTVWGKGAEEEFTSPYSSWIIDLQGPALFFPWNWCEPLQGSGLRGPGSHCPFKSGSVDSVVFPGSLMETESGWERPYCICSLFNRGLSNGALTAPR